MSGLFLQGNPGQGKSTLLHQELKDKELTLGGYYVQRLIGKDDRVCGFRVRSLGEEEVLLTLQAKPDDLQHAFIIKKGTKVEFNTDKFVTTARQSLLDLEKAQIIVLDEIGGVELLDDEFYQLIHKILSTCAVVGVFKSWHNHNLLKAAISASDQRLEMRRREIIKLFQRRQIELVTLTNLNYGATQHNLRTFLQGVGV